MNAHTHTHTNIHTYAKAQVGVAKSGRGEKPTLQAWISLYGAQGVNRGCRRVLHALDMGLLASEI